MLFACQPAPVSAPMPQRLESAPPASEQVDSKVKVRGLALSAERCIETTPEPWNGAYASESGIEISLLGASIAIRESEEGERWEPLSTLAGSVIDIDVRPAWPAFSFQASRYEGSPVVVALDQAGAVTRLVLSPSGAVVGLHPLGKLPPGWDPIAIKGLSQGVAVLAQKAQEQKIFCSTRARS